MIADHFYDEANNEFFSTTYSYDSNGNITSVKKYPYYVLSGTPLEEMKYYYNTTGWTDQISLIEYFVDESFEYFKTFAYDASGNLISENNKTFAWDGKQLTEVTFDGNAIAYKYDDQGIRTQKNVNGVTTNYYLDGSRVLHETNGTDVIYYTYDASGAPLSLNLNGTEYFYVSNLQGDIIEIVDINGNRLVTYQYDAWGNLKNHSDYSGVNLASKNPYRYRSYRYDNETGYYYLQSRYYDPSIGRFISADNVGYLGAGENLTSYNLYAYCDNNPVMYIDPTGCFVFTTAIIVGLIVGAIVGGTLGGVSAYKSAEAAGKTGSELFWATATGVGTGAVLGSAVGFVATAGTPFLIGGLMSVGGKFVSDLTAYASFGKPMGTWESYAVAFVFGGLTKGFGIGGPVKFGLDVALRPCISQLVEMGTRGKSWNTGKFIYDSFCRAGTYGLPGDLRPISRGLLNGLYYWLTQENSSLGYYYA